MPTISYEPDYNDDDIKVLTDGLDNNARIKRGFKPVETIALFLRDDAKKVIGGCNGLMYYGSLFIDQLWIDDAYRGQGYGKKLLAEAEQIAKQKGCTFIHLETMDWEALDYYRKLGFELEFARHGYNNDSVMYCLRKNW